MSLLSPFSELKEVRGAVLCDHDGNLAAADGETDSALSTAKIAALVRQMNDCGQLLGLGAMKRVLLKGDKSSCVAASRNGAIVTVLLDPKRPLTEVERLIENTDWDSVAPSDISDETNTSWPPGQTDPAAAAGRGEAGQPTSPFPVTRRAAPRRRPTQRGAALAPRPTGDARPVITPPCWPRPTPDFAPRWCEVSSPRPRASAT